MRLTGIPAAVLPHELDAEVMQHPALTSLASEAASLHLEGQAAKRRAWNEHARWRQACVDGLIPGLLQVLLHGSEEAVEAIAALLGALRGPFTYKGLQQVLHRLDTMRHIRAPLPILGLRGLGATNDDGDLF